jgi:hypothetical protein
MASETSPVFTPSEPVSITDILVKSRLESAVSIYRAKHGCLPKHPNWPVFVGLARFKLKVPLRIVDKIQEESQDIGVSPTLARYSRTYGSYYNKQLSEVELGKRFRLACKKYYTSSAPCTEKGVIPTWDSLCFYASQAGVPGGIITELSDLSAEEADRMVEGFISAWREASAATKTEMPEQEDVSPKEEPFKVVFIR